MIEESIDERNSMRLPFRFYTQEESFTPISDYEMRQSSKERDKLQKAHLQVGVDLWQGLV